MISNLFHHLPGKNRLSILNNLLICQIWGSDQRFVVSKCQKEQVNISKTQDLCNIYLKQITERFWEDGAKTSKLFGTKPHLKVQLFTIDGLTHNLHNSSFCAKRACGKDIMCHQSDSLNRKER